MHDKSVTGNDTTVHHISTNTFAGRNFREFHKFSTLRESLFCEISQNRSCAKVYARKKSINSRSWKLISRRIYSLNKKTLHLLLRLSFPTTTTEKILLTSNWWVAVQLTTNLDSISELQISLVLQISEIPRPN